MIIDFRREKTRTSGEGLTRRKYYNARFARFNLLVKCLKLQEKCAIRAKMFFLYKKCF